MDVEDLMELREGWEFEAKLAQGKNGRGAVPEAFWSSYSAMANTHGGQILLGAKENNDGSFTFKGLLDIDTVEQELWTTLENPQKVSVNLLQRGDVEQLSFDGKKLLLIHVPRAERSERPVHLKQNLNNAYLRVNEGDKKASDKVVQRMLADQLDQQDARIVEDFELDDLDDESVQRYREFLASRRPEHSALSQVGEEFLIYIGAATRERKEKRIVRPTYAGLWMLGKESSIRELFPHWHLSFIEQSEHHDDGSRWADRVATDGSWNGNLFQFYLRAIPKIFHDLQIPFSLDQGLFRRDETDVHTALREAFINALVHADYRANTPLRIRKNRSGFEFINPGTLLISVEQLWQGGTSVSRNPQLQRLFSLLQLGEREGSGGPTIQRVWKTQHWRTPSIREDVASGVTHLVLSHESLFPDWAVDALIQRFGQAFEGQDELGRLILVTVEIEGPVNHGRFRELHEAHGRDITLKLQELVRKSMLKSSGRTRGKVYTRVTDSSRELSQLADSPKETQISLEGSFAHKGSNSTHKGVRSTHKRSSSIHKDVSSTHKRSSSTHKNVSSNLSADAVQAVARSKRSSPELVRKAILALCEHEFQGAEAIARDLNRKPTGIRQNYLNAMVREGLLTLKYPDRPNHPEQAYGQPELGGRS